MNDTPDHAMALVVPNAKITKMEFKKGKGANAPVVMGLGIETMPLSLTSLHFMVPPGTPFALWEPNGELKDNAPECMNMKYKTESAHSMMVDDVIDFIAHRCEKFKATPVDDAQLTLSLQIKVIEPGQQLISTLASRIMSPIRFEVIGPVPDPQGSLDLEAEDYDS